MFAKVYRNRFTICCNLLIAILGFFISAPPVQAALVNINTAGSEELQTLTGIGPSYAERIIEYRNTNGLFQKTEDIKNVKGIGDATFLKIKDFVTVGDVSSTPNDIEKTNGSLDIASSVAMPTETSPISSLSTHYGSEELSNLSSESVLKIGAGRARLGVVGGPMEFKAEVSSSFTRTTSFKWSFGDGTIGEGLIVSHTYDYPGEYVVILSSHSNEGTATSRTDVRVIEPNLFISLVSSERVEVSNFSGSEINLYGRAFVSGDDIFAFPKDTIIKSGQKISFGATVTGLKPLNQNNIALILVGESGVNKIELEKIRKGFFNQISLLQKQILEAEKQLGTIVKTDVIKTASTDVRLPTESENQLITVINSTSTDSKETVGLVAKIKRFFLRTQ